ncbi:MAG TPA: ParB/RepB/Spo0J family partition protein [Candidatus Aquilonibacter sp.]|nr:ParB/RepB/Spo0J family partition protein [Candidatus Aquilonibacter sp.]
MDDCFDINIGEAGRLESRSVSELQPHPGLVRLGIVPAAQSLSALADRGEAAFVHPLTVTHDGYIIDGYARWALAKAQGRAQVPCVVRTISEGQALVQLLQWQHRSARLNDFNRIRLALGLEEELKVQARLRQQTAGRPKASSEMTKPQPLDVRTEIARVAGVSAGNVTHTKVLLAKAAPEVISDLAGGRIRIGRARKWLKSSKDGGLRELKNFQMTGAMRAVSKALLSRHATVAAGSLDHEFAPISKLPPDQQNDLLRHLLITLPRCSVQQVLLEAGVVHGV